MNIAMEQTQEIVNGQLKSTYADTFIRGNNGPLLPCPLLFLFYSLLAVLYIRTPK